MFDFTQKIIHQGLYVTSIGMDWFRSVLRYFLLETLTGECRQNNW